MEKKVKKSGSVNKKVNEKKVTNKKVNTNRKVISTEPASEIIFKTKKINNNRQASISFNLLRLINDRDILLNERREIFKKFGISAKHINYGMTYIKNNYKLNKKQLTYLEENNKNYRSVVSQIFHFARENFNANNNLSLNMRSWSKDKFINYIKNY